MKILLILFFLASANGADLNELVRMESATIRNPTVIYHYTNLSRKTGKDKNTGKYIGNYFRKKGKVRPLVIDHDKAHKWKTEYTGYVFDSIPDNSPLLTSKLNANGIGKLCPNYKNLSKNKKRMTWAVLIAAMAKFESSFNPKVKFKEPGKFDKNGKQIYSGGLLQTSIQDGRNYGCPYKTNADVFNPQKNIQCAIKIFERRVYEPYEKQAIYGSKFVGGKKVSLRIKPTYGKIFSEKKFNATKGDGIYWSVLNKHTGSGKEKTSYYGVKEMFEKYSSSICVKSERTTLREDLQKSMNDFESLDFSLDNCAVKHHI